jgi:hypothetical protein
MSPQRDLTVRHTTTCARESAALRLAAGRRDTGVSDRSQSDQIATAHLDDVRVPMLFLQGTRDEFATLSLLQALIIRLGSRATLEAKRGGSAS